MRFRMAHGQSRLCSLLAFVIQLLSPVELDAAHEVSVHPSQEALVCCHFSTVGLLLRHRNALVASRVSAELQPATDQ